MAFCICVISLAVSRSIAAIEINRRAELLQCQDGTRDMN